MNFCHALSGVLVTAHNGAEGLEAWRQHTPDIIITDIRMPAMDGLAMLQEIRSVDRAVPVIIMSAFEETEYLIRSIDIGVSGYTIKPVNVNKFTEVLLNCAHGLLVEAKLEQARTALRKQHEFTKATLDGQGAYICVINTQGDIVTTNSAWDNFAAENSATPGTCSVGSNYLDGVDRFKSDADSIKLIITDLIMPRMNGKQMYDEIRQIKPVMKALFCSGYSAKNIEQLGDLGVNAEFMAKPIQNFLLLKMVREMLDRPLDLKPTFAMNLHE